MLTLRAQRDQDKFVPWIFRYWAKPKNSVLWFSQTLTASTRELLYFQVLVVLAECAPLINESDLHISQLTMTLLNTMCARHTQAMAKVQGDIINQLQLLVSITHCLNQWGTCAFRQDLYMLIAVFFFWCLAYLGTRAPQPLNCWTVLLDPIWAMSASPGYISCKIFHICSTTLVFMCCQSVHLTVLTVRCLVCRYSLRCCRALPSLPCFSSSPHWRRPTHLVCGRRIWCTCSLCLYTAQQAPQLITSPCIDRYLNWPLLSLATPSSVSDQFC